MCQRDGHRFVEVQDEAEEQSVAAFQLQAHRRQSTHEVDQLYHRVLESRQSHVSGPKGRGKSVRQTPAAGNEAEKLLHRSHLKHFPLHTLKGYKREGQKSLDSGPEQPFLVITQGRTQYHYSPGIKTSSALLFIWMLKNPVTGLLLPPNKHQLKYEIDK